MNMNMNMNVWGDGETQFFYTLTPEKVLNIIDSLGFVTTGRYLTLNSMENRVFEIEIEVNLDTIKSESEKYVIAKFYRPGRWNKQQILDEHNFLFDLQADEISVIAPIKISGESLFHYQEYNIYFCLFPKKGGRIPQEMNIEQLEITGRMLARMHNVGESRDAKNRLKINPTTFGRKNLEFLLSQNFIPKHLCSTYEKLVNEICDQIDPLFKNIKIHRIHGDCHWGNIISRDGEGLFFIDFDDMLIGPAIQDIWLVVPGRDQYALSDRSILLEAYESMRDFDHSTLKLIEPLRTLRYIHFSSWIAKRWDDPSFKNSFEQFGNDGYWDIQINDLVQQKQIINETLS